jgi:D-alanyl-D-alanine carboxypeptidase (penicillin-binding protein 5/6)
MEESVTAPVSKGQRVGMMTIRAGEQVLRQIPLVAEETVPRLTWWQLFVHVLRQTAMGGA